MNLAFFTITVVIFLGVFFFGLTPVFLLFRLTRPLTPLEKKIEDQDTQIQDLIQRYVKEDISLERLEEGTESILMGKGLQPPPPPRKTPSTENDLCTKCHLEYKIIDGYRVPSVWTKRVNG